MEQVVFVGNYSKNGINMLEFNEDNSLKELLKIGTLENNSYVCKYKNYLYSVVEIQGDEKVNSGYVTSYEIKEKKVLSLNTKISYGKGPCFLIVDSLREILYIANYTEGSFVAFKIEEDGSIGRKLFYKQFNETSKIHHIQFSKDFKYMYIVDLGMDSLIEYYIDYNQNELNLIQQSKFNFPKNSEPRHMFIDEKNNIYVVTEKTCELYKLNHNKNNKLIVLENISILPDKVLKKEDYTGCAIKADSKTQYMYISIRGHNSISVFSITNNHIKLIQNVNCNGICPRDISFDKYENYLMCANQSSDNISIFNIQNGFLKYKFEYKIKSPSCIVVD